MVQVAENHDIYYFEPDVEPKKKTVVGPDRETWTGKFDFFLTALGYAVGLGAIWRFPYLCYKNGGGEFARFAGSILHHLIRISRFLGAFLIPYFTFLILVGIPLVFLEMSVGQFTSSGPMTCWVSELYPWLVICSGRIIPGLQVMSPIFRGIGFSVNIVNNYVNVYFTMILAYSLYFLFMSLRSELPWQKCNPNWTQKSKLEQQSSSLRDARFFLNFCL